MRDIEDLDLDEIAGMLEATTNAIKVRLHRAGQALRLILERDFGSVGANERESSGGVKEQLAGCG